MFDQWFKLPAHLYLRLTALTILIVGITLSNVLMSIGAIWIISNWLIEGDFKKKWERLKSRRSLWFVLFIFFFGLLSILWSDNAEYWFRDGRMKLPLLAIPLSMATSELLERKHFHFLLFVFFGMLTYTSLWNYLHFIDPENQATDIREMSRFISHVRLSTLLVIGIFSAIYCVVQNVGNRIILSLLIPWFLFYLYKSQVLNGYLLLSIISVFSMVYALKSISNIRYRLIAGFVFASGLVVASALFLQLLSSFNGIEKIDRETLPEKTINGNYYYHNFENKRTENGNYIWINMCQKELEAEWNRRSKIAYDSLNKKGYPLYGTLMRYMTSKGLKKDSVGVWSLTPEEIELIEEGCNSVVVEDGFKARLQAFMYDYETYLTGGDPNGHSIMQRMEHLKTAMLILKEEWIFGVGTGDLNDIFQKTYADTGSRLLPENRWRAHNQFLSIWISLGLIGFIVFVLMLIWPLLEHERRDYFLLIITLTLFFTSLFQDVLETQAGITIFALFYSLAAYRKQDLN
jgi:hypothetical protein